MVHLASESSVFAARVVAARLGADGIFVELRGAPLDSVYPLAGTIDLYVRAEELELARELLVGVPLPSSEPFPMPVRRGRRPVDPSWVYAAAVLAAVILGMAWLRDLLVWMQQ